jgi:hypothetical protein
VNVQDRTYDYLIQSGAAEVRVSAYIEVDLPHVHANYAELFVSESCSFRYNIRQVIPGSRTRTVELPGEMKAGEQLVVLVERSSSDSR